MAREVLFKLRIDDSDLSKIGKFETKFKQLGKEAETSLKQASSSWAFPHAAVERAARQTFRVIKDEVFASVKAFSEFEQGMREIQKVSNATEPELKRLGEQIRDVVITDLKGTTTVSQLQDIAEVSSKFGVATEDLTKFSTDIAKMSSLWDTTTTKTAENAAKITAQYRLDADELTKLGSAVDGLADSFGTNEAYLLDFSQRVSGIARLTNQSVTDVLAVGANIAVETGMRAQAGSSAYIGVFQKLEQNMFDFVKNFSGLNYEYSEALGELVPSPEMEEELKRFHKLLYEDGTEAFNQVLERMQALRDEKGPQALAAAIEDVFGTGKRINLLLTGMIDAADKNREAAKRGLDLFEEDTRVMEGFAARLNSQKTDITQVQAQWHNLQITLGDHLKDAIKTVTTEFQKTLMPVLQNLTDWASSPEGQIFFSDVLPITIKGLGTVLAGVAEILGAFVEIIQEIGTGLGNLVVGIQDFIGGIEKAIQKYNELGELVDKKVQGAWGKLTDSILGVNDAEKEAAKAEAELQEKIQAKLKTTTEGVQEYGKAVEQATDAVEKHGEVSYVRSVWPDIQREVFKATSEVEIMTQAVNFSSMTIQTLGNTSQHTFTSMQQSITTTTQKLHEMISAMNAAGGSGGGRQLLSTGNGTGSNVFVGTGREWSVSDMMFDPSVGTTVGGVPAWQNRLHGSGAALNSLTGFLSMHQGGILKAHNGLRPDEMPVVMQSGEGVLSRRGMQTLDKLNSGQNMGNNMTIIITGKVIDKGFMRELRQELQRSQNRVIGK